MDFNKQIADIDLTYPDLVLEEIFFIPADDHLAGTRRPVTIADLAEICGRTPEVVWHRLHEIEKTSRGIVVDTLAECANRLAIVRKSGQEPLLFDVRFADRLSTEPIAGALHLPTMTSPEWQEAYSAGQTGFVFSDDGRKAFSAAMWLRTQGRLRTFAVKTADLRGALTMLVVLLCVMFNDGNAEAADAESLRHSPLVKEQFVDYQYVVQMFVQRPSLKLLMSQGEDAERRSDQEVFDGMNYEAESMNAAGMKVSWKNVGLMATRRIGSDAELTTENFEDYQLAHYTEDFGINLRHQRYEGMIQLMNFKGPKNGSTDSGAPPINTDRKEKIRRPESSVLHESAAMQYLAWGKDFSLSGAFGDAPQTIRRGIGFPVFVALTKTEFDTGDHLVDERYALYFAKNTELNRVTTRNVYFGGGVAGTLPFGKFYVSGHSSIGGGGQKIDVTYTDDQKSSYDSAFKADLRCVFGWNIRQGFASITYDLEGTTFRIGQLKTTVQSDMISAATGVRL